MIKSIFKKIFSNKVAGNTIWIISERVVQMIISIIVGALSARYLGPSNYGLLNYGAAFVTFFSCIAKLGLDSIIVKEIIDNNENEGTIIGTSIVMRMISSIISIIIMVSLISILKPSDNVIILLSFLQSLSIIFQIYEIIDCWFQSKLKSKYVSIAKIIAYLVVSVYKIFLLVTEKSVVWFAVSMSLDYFIILIILLIMYKKNKGQKFVVSKEKAKYLLKNSYHFIISGLVVIMYSQMDKIMIGNMIDEFQLGLYSAASTICGYMGFVPEAIINSFRPIIYEAKKNNKKYLEKLKMLYFIVFWLGIMFCIFVTIFSKSIILILYGEEYISAQITLIIAVWYTAFAYLGSARSIWIVSEKKNKYVKKYVIIGGIINLLLNLSLIPSLGINGAAIATLISQIVVALIAPLFYKETRVSTKIIIEGIFLKGIKFKEIFNSKS